MLGILKAYIGRFISLTEEEMYVLSQLVEIRNFDKRVRLVDIGENEQYLNFIVQGLARKYFYNNNTEFITQIAREGEMICDSVSFFSDAPTKYIVETIEPTTFISITRANIEHLYQSSRKIEKLGRLIITDLFLQKEYWELDRIRYTTKDRFVKFVTENPDLLQRVPQKYLASYLNIKPETFSRLKHLLRTRPGNNARAKKAL